MKTHLRMQWSGATTMHQVEGPRLHQAAEHSPGYLNQGFEPQGYGRATTQCSLAADVAVFPSSPLCPVVNAAERKRAKETKMS